MISEPAIVKACCANLYGSELVHRLLGDSFHPGGVALTRRLADMLQIGPGSRVLDLAAGRGSSLLQLCSERGCEGLGVDLSSTCIAAARGAAKVAGLASRAQFFEGDVEDLPKGLGCFDAVICECALCTFPDKPAAVAQAAAALRPGGRLGIADLVRRGPLPSELGGLISWIACIADARPVGEYQSLLTAAGLTVSEVENHDVALGELVSDVRTKLIGLTVLKGLGKLPLGLDLDEAVQIARNAARAVEAGRLGYVLIVAERRADNRIDLTLPGGTSPT